MPADFSVKPEVSEGLRDLIKLSIEQARGAFETVAAASQMTWKSIETSSGCLALPRPEGGSNGKS
jgi:hypothetical protein